MAAAAAAAAAHGRAQHGRLQLPPGARRRAGPAAGRGGPARRDPARPGAATCRTGSSTRSSRWCGGCSGTRPGSGALGDIGAHIIDPPQFITGQRIDRRLGAHRDVRQGASAAGASSGLAPRAVATGTGRSRSTTRRCSSAGFTAAALGLVRGHPVRHRAQERAADRGQRLARQPRLRLRVDERAVVLRRRPSRPTTPGSGASCHRARPPVRRRLVAAGPRPRLRAHLHPRGRATSGGDRRRARDPTPSFADGLQVQRVLAAVEAQRRPTA